jgi:hypothetical protein
MAQSVRVLGIAHELQGFGFQGYVEDPLYLLLLKGAMRDVDMVFEEAPPEATGGRMRVDLGERE